MKLKFKKVMFKPREKTEKSKSKGVPFVVTYHPSLNCLHKIIRGNTYLLYMNEEVKNLFLPGPMASFRGVRKLSSYLVSYLYMCEEVKNLFLPGPMVLFRGARKLSSYLVSYLYMNEEAKNLVFPGPIVLFRGARKLSSYLVRNKFYPLHHKIGSKNVLKIVVKFVIM